jgi:hypothetical protein
VHVSGAEGHHRSAQEHRRANGPGRQRQGAILKAGNIVEVDLNGAKSGGVTMQTSPDAAAPNPVDSDIVPIAGDSVEYFDEIM